MTAGRKSGLVLGTAGHIDHGKTALIHALTGVDTDRLPEEKARGITIDLGFAALDLGEGLRLAVVDVPGHEGLVRTMVAGATGVDLVLLVVSSEEGVMPQTREHVAICDLLGIERGVVALSKADLADADMIELASEEVRELIEGTGLEGAEIVPLSVRSGEGLERLRETLRKLAAEAVPRTPRAGPARLPIDRVFAMRGFGTVVTGTLVGAKLATGAAVEVQPSGRRARIRGLQSHGEETAEITPGSRCAVNLQGLEVADLRRGDVLCEPDSLAPTTSADLRLVWLATAPACEDPVSVELLVGTAERRATLAAIGDSGFLPGGRHFARVHIEGDPLPLLPGDRFIARGFARSETAGATLGGGVVIDVAPPHRRRSDPALVRELAVLERLDPESGLRERIRRAGLAGLDAPRLARETGLRGADLAATLAALRASGETLLAGTQLWLDAQVVSRMQASLRDALAAFHAAEPLRPGMPRAALRGQLPGNVRPEAADLAMARLEAAGEIALAGDLVRLTAHRPRLDAAAEAAVARIRAEARSAGLEPPNPRDWAEALGIGLERFRDLVAHLERQGELLRAPGDLWFDRAAIDALRARVVAHLEQHGELDTQTYKTLIGTTRRTAMPLMELLDELHVTRRQGEVRRLRR